MINRAAGNFNIGTIAFILGVMGMLSVGQVLFKYAARTLDFSRPVTFLSFPLGVALILYGGATVLWLLVLTKVPLTIAFPFYGLVFLLVPLLSWTVLKEPVNLPTLIGSAVIALGVVIVATGSRV